MSLCASRVGRLFGVVTFASLVLGAVGCQQQPAAGAEQLSGEAPPFGQAQLYLPGISGPQTVSFQVIGGMAVMEGDILLGPADQLLGRYGAPRYDNAMGAVAIKNTDFLWPKAVIPYEIASSIPGDTVNDIQWAVQEAASAGITLRPKGFGDTDYVVFRAEEPGCHSFIGRIGGAQTININDCGRGSILHEVLHAAGFHHEQSRGDRDQFVTIMWDEIIESQRGNFEQRGASAQDIGPYDYASIMHYDRNAFSKSGRPTILPRDPNAPIGQRNGLSQLDRAAISQLYGGGSAGQTAMPGFPNFPGLPFPIPGTAPSGGGPAPGPTAAPGWQTPFGTVPAPSGFPLPTNGGGFPLPAGGALPLPLPGGTPVELPQIFQ